MPTAIPNRREFKYLVPRAHLPALRAALDGLCDLDPHAGPDRTYGLRSLYFDSPGLRLYHANEREAVVRFKARVRCYPDSPGSPVFAEVKRRTGDVIHKSRAKLPDGGWADALGPDGPGAGADDALGAFLSRMHRYQLRPVVLVEYRREAYVSRLDDYARVSIDTRIGCQRQTALTLDAPRSWRPIDQPWRTWTPMSPCVVELKWARQAPRWMADLVQRVELLRHAFSKYCGAMLALSDDHFRDYRRAQSLWG